MFKVGDKVKFAVSGNHRDFVVIEVRGNLIVIKNCYGEVGTYDAKHFVIR